MGESRVRVLCLLRVRAFQFVLNDTRDKKLSKSMSVIAKHYKDNYAILFLFCLLRHEIFQTKIKSLSYLQTIQFKSC